QNGSPTSLSVDETYEFLERRLSVEQTRMTSLIEISVRNQDAGLAARIANQVAESYRKFRVAQWRDSRGRGIGALQDKLTTMQSDLQAAQTNLDNLRTKLHVDDVYDQSAVSLDLLSKSLEDWDHQRGMAKADYLEYSNILANLQLLPTNQLGGALQTAYAHQSDPELVELAGTVRLARERMVDVVQNYGPDMPGYKIVKTQLAQSEAAYQNKIDAVMAGITTRVNEDKGFLQLCQQEEEEITKTKNEQAQRNRPYYDAKSEVELKRRNCDQLQTLLIRETVELGQPNENVVIVCDPARADKYPIWPKPTIIIPLGVFVGLLVGLGLAFFIEYLDTSVKTIDDVERSLQAPVLGVIPQNVGLILDEGAESPHAEAYRVLRTNLLFSRKNEGWNTISVLSGGAGEGKSTTLFNLATVFAQNGQRILVVDSDLRRPTLHKVLHVSNTVGLTDFLLKQRPLEEVIQKTKVPTLDFMASGKLPSSSMSILGSAQMKETIAELKRRYEFIFFDSPPLLGVSDASILASEMDMVLQVIQYRRYPQPMTLRAKQMILKVGGNLIGIVLNNINMSQDENYYYYSGYYEYQSHAKDENVVQVADPGKTASVEIKPKY
ncbi:MAG TPA: polysaccharide biosynthesis tyrosine autokinase, partial [Candidatus Cybelea sp.]|nr:polysaccharide biosynthesis tyrosine autokinase [Candidatus Cybelea sp.]